MIEFLVVVAILGILAALTVPAVQSARDQARRALCLNNLHQIGLAAHSYCLNVGSLPLAITPNFDSRYVPPHNPQCYRWEFNDSLLAAILPYIDQPSLYNAFNRNLYVLSIDNRTVAGTLVAAFACPADYDALSPLTLTTAEYLALGYAWDGSPGIGRTSYAGFGGSLDYFPLPGGATCSVPSQWSGYCNGAFGAPPVRLASFTDGLATTMLIGERSLSALQPYDTTFLPDLYRSANIWIDSHIASTLVTAFWAPNQLQLGFGASSAAQKTWSASSLHAGGLNILFADGSVRFVKSSVNSWPVSALTDPNDYTTGRIPPGVWQRLATRNGGEAISSGDY